MRIKNNFSNTLLEKDVPYSYGNRYMADSLMFNNDAYVVLETGKEEQLLTPDEMVDKLRDVLTGKAEDLPLDLRKFTSIDDQIQYLLDTSCEIDLAPGEYLQWYAVRLEK